MTLFLQHWWQLSQTTCLFQLDKISRSSAVFRSAFSAGIKTLTEEELEDEYSWNLGTFLSLNRDLWCIENIEHVKHSQAWWWLCRALLGTTILILCTLQCKKYSVKHLRNDENRRPDLWNYIWPPKIIFFEAPNARILFISKEKGII